MSTAHLWGYRQLHTMGLRARDTAFACQGQGNGRRYLVELAVELL